jgi:hypothetical protein
MPGDTMTLGGLAGLPIAPGRPIRHLRAVDLG